MSSNSNTKLLSRYWLFQQFGGAKGDTKWSSFVHSGVMFPDLYKPHGIPILYNGIEVKLPALAEEYATLYARYLDTEYIKSKTFNKNFFKSWKPTLKSISIPIESLELCDFTAIAKYLEKEKTGKKSQTSEKKAQVKEDQDKVEESFKTALVDNKPQPVGNYKMEPPGIFIGRGCHPKLGTIKKRIEPNDVIGLLDKVIPMPGVSEVIPDPTGVQLEPSNKSNLLVSVLK